MNNELKDKLKYTLTHKKNCPWLGVHFSIIMLNWGRTAKLLYKSCSEYNPSNQVKIAYYLGDERFLTEVSLVNNFSFFVQELFKYIVPEGHEIFRLKGEEEVQ